MTRFLLNQSNPRKIFQKVVSGVCWSVLRIIKWLGWLWLRLVHPRKSTTPSLNKEKPMKFQKKVETVDVFIWDGVDLPGLLAFLAFDIKKSNLTEYILIPVYWCP